MERRYVSTATGDRSSVIAAFFIGIATSLFVLLYWISIKNLVIFFFMSLATFVIFLVITALLARPRRVLKVASVRKFEPVKKEEKADIGEPEKSETYVGSTQTKTYHKSTCRFAKSIKPKFRVENDDKSFFKKYKACSRCKP
jgi:hypothetical protein